MEWLSILALLTCPLMMLLCLKGMSGHRDCHNDSDDTLALRHEILELKRQNEQLRKEIQSLQSVSTTFMKNTEKAHHKL